MTLPFICDELFLHLHSMNQYERGMRCQYCSDSFREWRRKSTNTR